MTYAIPNPTPPIRVLLVDDHPVVCSGLSSLIEQQTDMLVVGHADDGVSAQQRVAEVQPDVVVMDLLLPRLGGAEATQHIKTSFPDVKVLALTALDEPAPLQRALRAGASGVMLKRSAPQELLRAIRLVAEGRQYLDASVEAQLKPGPDAAGRKALSEREREVLKLLAAGVTAKDIAGKLCISVRTLETYRARAMEKLGLKSRADIVRYAASRGWLPA